MTAPKDILQRLNSADPEAVPEWVEKRYLAELITPMYGGGRFARQTDARHPFRGKGIKHGLRFWWRLLAEAGVLPVQAAAWTGRKLYEEECSRFGGRSVNGEPVASVVRVCSTSEASGWAQPGKNQGDWNQVPTYVHGLLGAERGTVTLRASSDLRIRIRADREADLRAEIDQATRWWSQFGGVGSRTRRGMGSLRLTLRGEGVQADPGDAFKPINHDEAALAGCLLVQRPANSNSLLAWEDCMGRFARFRREGQSTKSRSHWPEPNLLRSLVALLGPIAGQTPTTAADEELPAHTAAYALVMPRSAYGLPIVGNRLAPAGHVKREDTLGSFRILPADGDRMASPLIFRIRPVPGQEFEAVVLLLPQRFRDEALGMPLRVYLMPVADRRTPPAPPPAPPSEKRKTPPRAMLAERQLPGPAVGTLQSWNCEDANLPSRVPPIRRNAPGTTDPLTAAMVVLAKP